MHKKVSGEPGICHNRIVSKTEGLGGFGGRRGPIEDFVGGNSVKLLRNGGEAYPEMLDAIARASTRVWLEMYWFDSDSIGRRFAAELESAARRGVQVRLLYDSFGCLGSDGRLFRGLAKAGAEVVEYNPISPFEKRFRVARLVARDHRKLLIADDTAFVGGMNIADEWLPLDEGGEDWRDDVVRVRGPVLAQLHRSFEAGWCEFGGTPNEQPIAPPMAAGRVKAAALSQARFRQRRQALDAYLSRLAYAQKQVFLSSAYFVPNGRIIRALRRAARRGADVRVMLPAKSDVEIVRFASQAAWTRLLKAGVRLLKWEPTVLHSKSAVIDGVWATVGSFNLDYLSLFTNAELNLSVLDSEFADQMIAAFLEDQAHCTEVNWSQFRSRPVAQRVAERALYYFRDWL